VKIVFYFLERLVDMEFKLSLMQLFAAVEPCGIYPLKPCDPPNPKGPDGPVVPTKKPPFDWLVDLAKLVIDRTHLTYSIAQSLEGLSTRASATSAGELARDSVAKEIARSCLNELIEGVLPDGNSTALRIASRVAIPSNFKPLELIVLGSVFNRQAIELGSSSPLAEIFAEAAEQLAKAGVSKILADDEDADRDRGCTEC
jgi:hypothetical protein